MIDFSVAKYAQSSAHSDLSVPTLTDYALTFFSSFRSAPPQFVMDKFEFLPIKCNVTLGRQTSQKHRDELVNSKFWGNRTPKTKVKTNTATPTSIHLHDLTSH
jgi:hypothetical protein